MEAAGLAVGIIALIGTFKDCIDLFSYITVARSLGRDYELLSTKLDVEKAFLLQWAQRTNLLRPNYDRRLDEPKIRATVAQIVSSIRILLSDTKILQQRYGMQESQPGDEAYSSLLGIGAGRMSTFTKDFGKLDLLLSHFEKLDLRIRGHRVAPCTLKTRWAVRDKDKFGDLLQELSYFVSRLHDLVPDTNNTIQTMTEEDMQPLSNRKTVRLLLEAASGRDDLLAAIAERHHIQICESRILRCIWYRLMDDRRDALSPPNPLTFEWALDPYATNLKWDNITRWLSHDSRIYWICGKAGSGKSTLMKYLYSHPKTKELLECWAGETQLTIASFFFSYLGTEIQKSQEGLSRALLFKILSSERSIIPELLPNMWADAYGTDENITPPSSAELRQAFEKMGENQSRIRKFCIFIDGLDEYSGKPLDGVNFILDLARNCNMKIVISSRPIQPCARAFSRMPKLYLQDLTAGDIRTYIKQTVDSHPHMGILRREDLRQTDDLRRNIIKKAYGVFLWVVLACRSVREGLDNFDRLSDLRRRIDELPPELERLFQHMLSNIEGRYQDHAFKILRICHQNQLMSGTQGLFTLGLALVDGYDLELGKLPCTRSLAANEAFATPLDRQRRNDKNYTKCMILEGRLRSHCLGLVEIKRASLSYNDSCFCGYRPRWTNVHDEIIDSTIEFMHRTVFDFLSARGTAEFECRGEDRETFDPSTALACISLHLAGLTLHHQRGATHVQDVLVHTASISVDRYSQAEMILIRLQELLLGQSIPGVNTLSSVHIYGKVDQRAMADIKASKLHLALLLAIELGITSLLQLYECTGRGKLSNFSLHIPLLCRALEHPLTKGIVRGAFAEEPLTNEKDIDMVRYLIVRGCSPNEPFLDSRGIETTPWEQLLRTYLYTGGSSASNATTPLIIDLFLEGGAQLDRGAMLFTEAQKAAEVDQSLKQIHRSKGGFVKDKTSRDLCVHFLQKIAGHKTTSSLEPSTISAQDKGRNPESYLTHKPRAIPQLRTSWKRARSLSPPRLDRSKFHKFNTDGGDVALPLKGSYGIL